MKVNNQTVGFNIKALEEKYIKLDSYMKAIIPNPPEPPLSRVLKEGVGHFCSYCHSTMSKDGFLGLFGEMLCHNPKCPNSLKKSNK